MDRIRMLLIGAIFFGTLLLGVGIYPAVKPEDEIDSFSAQPQSFSKAKTYNSNCVVKYPSGSCWTIQKPNYDVQLNAPSDFEYDTAKVSISEDGLDCTIIVPADSAHGISARVGKREFIIRAGDEYQVSAKGNVLFSEDHPRVDPKGLYGWYDPHVDGPFKSNVGGLEYSIGDLSHNRYFGGETKTVVARDTGVPVARIIERSDGYYDQNKGGHKITFRILKRAP